MGSVPFSFYPRAYILNISLANILLPLSDDPHDELRSLSSREGMPVVAYIRKGVELVLLSHHGVLSGAMVLGIQVHTTSGSVWIKGV